MEQLVEVLHHLESEKTMKRNSKRFTENETAERRRNARNNNSLKSEFRTYEARRPYEGAYQRKEFIPAKRYEGGYFQKFPKRMQRRDSTSSEEEERKPKQVVKTPERNVEKKETYNQNKNMK